MEKNVRIRFIAALLAVVIIAPVLRGWMGGNMMSAAEKMDKDHIYKAEYIKMPESISLASKLYISNDKLYIGGYGITNDFDYSIIQMNPDGSGVKNLMPDIDKVSKKIINCFTVDSIGNLYYLLSKFYYDVSDWENPVSKMVFTLVKIDKDGKEVLRQELDIESLFCFNMFVDKDGKLVVISDEELVMFDKTGKRLGEINTGDTFVSDIMLTRDGRMLAVLYNDINQPVHTVEVRELLAAEMKFGESVKMSKTAPYASFFEGADYDFYIHDGINVYGYNIKSGEKKQLLNWIDSDMNGSLITDAGFLSDGRIVCIVNDYEGRSEIAVMSKAEPGDVADKKMLTLACVSSDYYVNSSVVEFNSKNDKYRITMKDYSVSNNNWEYDYGEGNNKLNTDLISGDVPDILIVNDTGFFEGCADKGLFADLNTFIEKDSGFKKENYLTNVIDALAEEGKLYVLVPFFDVYTVIGKTKNVGSRPGWTLDDLEKVMEKMPKDASSFDEVYQSQIMYYGYNMCMDQFIDWKEGRCAFDTGEFAKLLKFADRFPKEEEKGSTASAAELTDSLFGNETDYDELKFRKNKILLNTCLLNDFNDIHEEQVVNFGDDITFIGFPTANKKGSAISPGLQLAVSAKTDKDGQQACWEFLKMFMSDGFQDKLENYWPTKLTSLDKKKRDEQKPDIYIDEDGKEAVYEDTAIIDGKEKIIGKVTDKECKKVINFLKSLDQAVRFDQTVYDIIEEETNAYFAGRKSAEKTSQAIQNRVQTYLNGFKQKKLR